MNIISPRGVSSFRNYLTNPKWVILIALFCSVLWGSAFPVLKVSYLVLGMSPDDLSANIVLAGIRFFLASILIFGLIALAGINPMVKKAMFPKLFSLSLMQIGLQYFFFYNGMAHTSGMKGAVLSSAGIFFVVVLAHFVYTDDRLDWRKVLGLFTGFSGVILVNYGKHFSFDFSWQGEGFMICSGLASAVGTIMAKRYAQSVHPFVLTAWQMLLGSLLLISVGLPGLRPQAMEFTAEAYLLLLYSAFISAVAFSLWYTILKYNKAGKISVYNFMTPVSGAILSALFIPGESLTVNMFLGLALAAGGIIVVNWQKTITGLKESS